jgi:hypothetical protein
LIFIAINIVSGNQFSRLPLVFIHFFEHSVRDKSIDFGEFLVMHYGGSDNNDDDEKKDSQLPFKSMSSGTSPFCELPDTEYVFSNYFVYSSEVTPSKFRNSFIPAGVYSVLFRPPLV